MYSGVFVAESSKIDILVILVVELTCTSLLHIKLVTSTDLHCETTGRVIDQLKLETNLKTS